MYEINRKLTWSGLKAGIVITLALVILFLTVFFTGTISGFLKPKSSLYVNIKNAQGLRSGAPVWLHGIEKGFVKSIIIQPDGVIIEIALDRSLIHYLRKDATANITSLGIMGDKFIEIFSGVSVDQLSATDTIQGLNMRGFEDIIATSTSTMAQLDSTARNLTILIGAIRNDNGTIGKLINDSTLYDNLTDAFNSLTISLRQFHQANGSLSRLLHDSTLYDNLSVASVQLNRLINNIDSLVYNVEKSFDNGSIAGTIFNKNDLTDSLRQTISSYRSTAKSLSELINEIKLNPRKFFNLEIF